MKTIQEQIKDFELSSDTILIVYDKFLDLRFTINRSNVCSITYSQLFKDEVYMNFITNVDLWTRFGIVKKGELVKNWTIDKECKIEIEKVSTSNEKI